MNLAIDFGNRVKKLRYDFHLTLDQLCERASISKTCLWEIEQGKTLPRIDTALKIADVFSVRVGFLIEGDRDPDKSAPKRAKALKLLSQLRTVLVD